MITIPVEGFNPQESEELNTICQALFIEVNDKRLMSILSKEDVASYVSLLMEDSVCETLHDISVLFGERDFVKFIKPVVTSLASSDYDKSKYLPLLKKSVEVLI